MFDDLTELDMIGGNVLEALFVKVYPSQANQIPSLRAEYKGNFLGVVKTIMQASGLDSNLLRQIITDSDEHRKLEQLLKTKLNVLFTPLTAEEFQTPLIDLALAGQAELLGLDVKSEPEEQPALGLGIQKVQKAAAFFLKQEEQRALPSAQPVPPPTTVAPADHWHSPSMVTGPPGMRSMWGTLYTPPPVIPAQLELKKEEPVNDFLPGDSLDAYSRSFPIKKPKKKIIRCRPSLCKPVCTGRCGRPDRQFARPKSEEPSPHSGPSFVIEEMLGPGNFASSSNTQLVEVAGLGWFEAAVPAPSVQVEPKEEQAGQQGSLAAKEEPPVPEIEPKEEQAGQQGSLAATQQALPVPTYPGETEAVAARPAKRRRGKPRNRPGSNERRWNKLEESGP